MEKLFDLNIEQVLEHWEPEHALRELIANALDEQILTQSEPINVYKEDDKWHVRDYGRGLKYVHFTQNESKEKIDSPNLIGKFGVGLKDALAVFYRKHINVEINSKYANIKLIMTKKAGFDVETLHASFNSPKDPDMVGTDFIISGITDKAVDKAKSMFLYFNQNVELLEKTQYGEVYRDNSFKSPVIYINGVQIAIEDNFLFSYNITNINSQIKKALNRERSNVGRSAYSDSIKHILKKCESYSVLSALVNDLDNVMRGTNHDESNWGDIAAYAAKALNKNKDVVFMTPTERNNLSNQELEILKNSGKELVMITESVYTKIASSVSTFDDVCKAYNDNFKYEFIDYSNLTRDEQKVFDNKDFIIDFLKKHHFKTDAIIKISETICLDSSDHETLGVCQHQEKTIIIKRSELSSLERFASVLIHEFAHYHSKFPDNSRGFENVLTKLLGYALYELIYKSYIFDSLRGDLNES